MGTITVTPNTDKSVTFESKLAPFQAMYLMELACHLACENNGARRASYKARVDFLKDIMEVEKEHPDWHFEDFELWVRRYVEI